MHIRGRLGRWLLPLLETETMRAFLLFYISLLLVVVDRSTTWIALEEKLGEESNPHVNTESLLSLFLSPVPLQSALFFLVCLVLCESYPNRVHALLASRHPLSYMCLLPLMFIWMMSIVCASNLMGALGFGTPLAWFASKFDFITKDRHELIMIAFSVLNLAALPFLYKLGMHIYAPDRPPITGEKPSSPVTAVGK